MKQESSIRSTMKSGAKWTTVALMTDAITQMARLAILARFLTKGDFGVVAISTVVLGLSNVFSDLGFSVGIMSRKDVTRQEFASVYWTQLILFTAIYVLLSCCSPIVAAIYETPQLIEIIPFSLLALPINGMGKLYDTVIHKNMQFRTMAVRGMTANIVSLVFAYLFCIWNFGIYSLIFSTLLNTLIINLWNFIAGQRLIRISLHFCRAEVVPFFKIGIYKMGTHIFDYVSNKIDVMLLGSLLGMESLGLYNLAKELLQRLYGIIQQLCSKVVLPLLANAKDKETLRTYYCRVVNLCAFIGFPLMAVFFAFAPYIVLLLYGEAYIEIVPYVRLFAILFAFNVIGFSEGSLVSATGRTELDFYWTIIRVSLTILVTFLLARLSIDALIIGQIIIGAFGIFYLWRFIINPIIDIPIATYLSTFIREMLVSAVSAIVMSMLIMLRILPDMNIILETVAYAIIFIVLYTGLTYLINKKNLAYFSSLVFKR